MGSRTPIPDELRRLALEDYSYTCVYCGGHADSVDHVVPYSILPEHNLENLVACCTRCNSIAGAREFNTFSAKYMFIREARAYKEDPRRGPPRTIVYWDGAYPETTTISDLRFFINTKVNNGASYADLGRAMGVNRGVLWKIAHEEYEPKDLEIRRRLGLPTSATLNCINGVEVHSGSMLGFSAKHCECGVWFIPNVPWRKWCFYCRPIK